MADQTFGVTWEAARKGYPVAKSHLEDLVGILMHEGWSSHNELVCEDTKSVPVSSATMPFIQYDLRRNVLRCAAESIGAVQRFNSLDESKVGKLEEAILLHKHILWF